MMAPQKLGPRQQAWVDALRSGKYAQGRCFLQADGRYCCLGVACDLVPGLEWVRGSAEYMGRSDFSYLPETVREYYGFNSCSGSIYGSQEKYFGYTLTRMNDEKRLTFDRIADLVEANPSSFFKESK